MLQKPVIAGSPNPEVSAKLGELRAKVGELKLQISDLETRRGQLSEQRSRLAADVSPEAINKQLAESQHELAAKTIQLEQLNQQIDELQTERDLQRMFNLQGPTPKTATTTLPREDPFATQMDLARGVAIGGFVLMIPLVLAFARRIWHRGGPHVVNLEDSPRLQRMEQAIESIAVEVERIGEAQRFTTKLLAERQPDAVARLSAMPRKEPGTITPH